MIKNRIESDTISEEEYTNQMASASTSPEDDSPGDSEADAGAEFEMGLNFDPEQDLQADDSAHDGTRISANDNMAKASAGLRARTEDGLPDTAKVIASDLPEPSLDLDERSDTH